MPAGEVAGVAQPAGLRVEGARGADDHPPQVGAVQPGGLDGLPEGLGHLIDGLRALGVGDLVGGDDRARDVGDGRQYPLRGDVEAADVRGPRVDRVELGAGAGAAAVRAGGDDESDRFQTGQQLGGGGLGQPGQVPDTGPGERAVRQHEFECGPVVHGAQQAGRSGRGGGHRAALPHRGDLLGKFPITC